MRRAAACLALAACLLGAARAQNASAIFPELLGALTGGGNGTSGQAYLYSVASELASGFEDTLAARSSCLRAAGSGALP